MTPDSYQVDDVIEYYEQLAQQEQGMREAGFIPIAEFAAKLREEREAELARWNEDYGKRTKRMSLWGAICTFLISGGYFWFLITRMSR